MAKPAYFSRHIVLAGSILFGVLLALGIHIINRQMAGHSAADAIGGGGSEVSAPAESGAGAGGEAPEKP